MLNKLSDGYYQSTLLSPFPSLIHGFTSRALGDMRDSEVRNQAVHRLTHNRQKLLWVTQTHGTEIYVVRTNDSEVLVSSADGFVYQKKDGVGAPILSVHAADCTPILFYDPIAEIVGCVHAGWRGTLDGIALIMIDLMRSQGSDAKDILACIGPHIGACCYDVPEERATAFIERFSGDEKIAFKVESAWYLDIGWVNYRQLLAAGVMADHIDAPPTCTSCQNNEFFSYRKDSKETYGEMMAVIGFR